MLSTNDGDIHELRRWRDEQVELGRFDTGTVSDAALNRILRNAITVREVRAELPPAAQDSVLSLMSVLEDLRELPVEPIPVAAAPIPTTPIPTTPIPVEPVRPAAAAPPAGPGSPTTGPSSAPPLPGPDDFTHNTAAPSSGPRAELRITRAGAGYRIEWPADPEVTDPVTLYRVVGRDDYEPRHPDGGRSITVTADTVASDEAALATAVRYIAVWRHTGATVEAAVEAIPELVGREHILASVQDWRIGEDHGVVTGTWRSPPGIRRVQIQRIPERELHEPASERHRILADQLNLHGFTDTTAAPGVTYHYRVTSEIELGGGTVLAEPVEAPVRLPGELRPVTDLTATAEKRNGRMMLDLSWTPPESGEVYIYRTRVRPPENLADLPRTLGEVASSAIAAEARLATESRLPNFVHEGVPARMTDVVWPPDWSFVHLTPATAQDGMVRVGRTVTVVRPAAQMRFARVVERYHEQLVTFAWPAGADEIQVHAAAAGVPTEVAAARPAIAEITKSRYERDGGLHLPVPLPPEGCVLHLIPVTFAGSDQLTRGEVTEVAYAGLRRVRYALAVSQQKRGDRWLHIRLRPETDIAEAPPFRLALRANRLPLSLDDADDICDSYLYGESGSRMTAARIEVPELRRDDPHLVWHVKVTGRSGYVRLFAEPEPEARQPLAVLDPSLRDLRLDTVQVR